MSALQSEAGDLGDSKNEEIFQPNKGSTVTAHFKTLLAEQMVQLRLLYYTIVIVSKECGNTNAMHH